MSASRLVVCSGVAGLAALCTFDVLPAQPPPGWIVASSFASPHFPNNRTAGGLFLLHPRDSTRVPFTVSGLPKDLTGTVNPTVAEGSSGIAVLPDGDLLVGELAPRGATLEVRRVRLQRRTTRGWAASIVATYPIGPVPQSNAAEVTDIEVLPDGRVLVALHGLQSGPFAFAKLLWLDTATGTFTVVSTVVPPGTVNALASDPTGAIAYLGQFTGQGGRVWQMGLAPVSRPTPLSASGAIPGGILSMAVDSTGSIVVGTIGSTGSNPPGTPPNMHRVDPLTGAVKHIHLTQGVRNALTIEVNTDRIISMGPPGGSVMIEDGRGGLMPLPKPPQGMGVLAGLAMVPAVQEYGRLAVSDPPYRWRFAPNPGGIPTVGNRAFSLTLETTASPSVSAFALATAAAPPTPLPGGFVALISLQPPIHVAPITVQRGTSTIRLGIPAMPALAGHSVFGQTFHVDASGAVSAPGVRVSIL